MLGQVQFTRCLREFSNTSTLNLECSYVCPTHTTLILTCCSPVTGWTSSIPITVYLLSSFTTRAPWTHPNSLHCLFRRKSNSRSRRSGKYRSSPLEIQGILFSLLSPNLFLNWPDGGGGTSGMLGQVQFTRCLYWHAIHKSNHLYNLILNKISSFNNIDGLVVISQYSQPSASVQRPPLFLGINPR